MTNLRNQKNFKKKKIMLVVSDVYTSSLMCIDIFSM